MKKVTIIFAMLAVMGIGAASAQKTVHFSLRAGGLFPQNRFAQASGDYLSGNGLNWGVIDYSNKGGAGMGLTFGMQVKFDIKSVKGLGILLGVDGMYNALNADVNAFYEDQVDAMDLPPIQYSMKMPVYFNIPAMVGVGYSITPIPNIGFFAEAAMGANLRFITNMVETTYDQSLNQETVVTTEFNRNLTFAYRFGAGVIFKDKYTLGIDWYNLGTAKLQGLQHTEINGVLQVGSPVRYRAGKITPVNVALRFGITF